MQNQSNYELTGKLAPVTVDRAFPVSKPDFNTRNEFPDVAPHLHDLPEIGYCYDGGGIFLIGRKIFTFKRGDAVFINNREVHLAKSNPGETTSWGFVSFDPERLLPPGVTDLPCCRNLPNYCGKNFRNIIDGSAEPELAGTVRMILEELRDRKSEFHSMVRALVWQLMLHLERRHRYDDSEENTPGDYHDMERLLPALNYIEAHFNQTIEVPELARLCCTSEPNFRRWFLRAMGCAPLPFIITMRLNVACAMLRSSDRPILEIALACGFATLSCFNRQFRKKFNMTPRDYRSGSGHF